MAIDTFKITERKKLVIDTKKNLGIPDQKAQVILALDYSGSMSDLYRKGIVQDTVERILPIALGFDDDGTVDTYIFENDCNRIPEGATVKNLDGYVQNKILNGGYRMAGTSYAPIINQIVADFGAKKKGGFLGMGSKPGTSEIPVYVIFITDGENDDKVATEDAIREAANYGIFFQFVGIGNERFNFLTKLDDLSGRTVDNADFFKVSDLQGLSDTDLYSNLMNEFPSWIKAARSANLIK